MNSPLVGGTRPDLRRAQHISHFQRDVPLCKLGRCIPQTQTLDPTVNVVGEVEHSAEAPFGGLRLEKSLTAKKSRYYLVFPTISRFPTDTPQAEYSCMGNACGYVSHDLILSHRLSGTIAVLQYFSSRFTELHKCCPATTTAAGLLVSHFISATPQPLMMLELLQSRQPPRCCVPQGNGTYYALCISYGFCSNRVRQQRKYYCMYNCCSTAV